MNSEKSKLNNFEINSHTKNFEDNYKNKLKNEEKNIKQETKEDIDKFNKWNYIKKEEVENNILILNKTQTVDYIQFKRLLEFSSLLFHAFTLKNHEIGFSRKKESIREKSYDAIDKAFNINRHHIIQPYQEHTNNIYELNKNINELENLDEYQLKETDGIISSVKGAVTLLTYADCIPLLFYDPKMNIMANVHSGWRGTVKKIAKETVSKLIKDYDCEVKNIICCIGPCIRKENFLVNEDVANIFKETFKNYINKEKIIEDTDLFNDIGQQYKIDNVLINKMMLEEAGIKNTNIIDSEISTFNNSYEYHSRRSENYEDFNTNGCIMMLK